MMHGRGQTSGAVVVACRWPRHAKHSRSTPSCWLKRLTGSVLRFQAKVLGIAVAVMLMVYSLTLSRMAWDRLRLQCLVSVHDLLARTSWTDPSSPRRFIMRREQASQQATFFPRIAGSAKTHSSSHVEKLRREAFPDPAK